MYVRPYIRVCHYPHSKLHAGLSKAYALKDIHGNYFYVGTTHGSLRNRLYQHIKEAETIPQRNPMKSAIIIENDFNILIEELEAVWMTSSKNGFDILRRSKPLEDKWILELKARGYCLTNVFYCGKRNKPSISTTKSNIICEK